MPAMMTNSTMNSLTPTRTRLTRIDSLMPMVISVVMTAISRNDSRSKWSPAPSDSGQAIPISLRNSSAYWLQPWATTLAPSISSSRRSHPMIQATISPRVA